MSQKKISPLARNVGHSMEERRDHSLKTAKSVNSDRLISAKDSAIANDIVHKKSFLCHAGLDPASR